MVVMRRLRRLSAAGMALLGAMLVALMAGVYHVLAYWRGWLPWRFNALRTERRWVGYTFSAATSGSASRPEDATTAPLAKDDDVQGNKGGKGNKEKDGKKGDLTVPAAAAGGALTGAASGAAIGLAGGPVGAAVGGVIGAVLGAVVGGLSGAAAVEDTAQLAETGASAAAAAQGNKVTRDKAEANKDTSATSTGTKFTSSIDATKAG